MLTARTLEVVSVTMVPNPSNWQKTFYHRQTDYPYMLIKLKEQNVKYRQDWGNHVENDSLLKVRAMSEKPTS